MRGKFLRNIWFRTAIILSLIDALLWVIFTRMNYLKYPVLHGVVFYMAVSLPFWVLWVIIMGIIELLEERG